MSWGPGRPSWLEAVQRWQTPCTCGGVVDQPRMALCSGRGGASAGILCDLSVRWALLPCPAAGAAAAFSSEVSADGGATELTQPTALQWKVNASCAQIAVGTG